MMGQSDISDTSSFISYLYEICEEIDMLDSIQQTVGDLQYEIINQKNTSEVNNKIRKFKCNWCSCVYASSDGAKKHARKHHINELKSQYKRNCVDTYCCTI